MKQARYATKTARRRKVNRLYERELMNIITNDVDKLQGQANTIIDKLLPLYIEGERWVDNVRYVVKSPSNGIKSRKTSFNSYETKLPRGEQARRANERSEVPKGKTKRIEHWLLQKLKKLLTNS